MKDSNYLEIELEGILNASNDNIVITDAEGFVLKVSPNCTTIYGKEAEELIGKSVYELQKRNVFKPSISRQVLEQKKEVQVMQSTLNGRFVMATGIPLFDANNDIIRVISFSHDLTEIQNLKEEYEQLQFKMKQYENEINELKGKDPIEGIVMKSEKMKKVWYTIKQISTSDANIVLLGESGVGKSMYARTIHNICYEQEPFISVNCGAIPDNLFETEIFGYESGAFTGAGSKGKAGLVELAQGGTLFLDEVGEIPLDQQVKLLKVLDEKQVFRVGSTKPRNVNFRLITATNQDLGTLVEQRKFRQDLFYRLNVIPLTIPPLRERVDDIYQLAQYYLSLFNKKYKNHKTFDFNSLEAFQNYDWPGNVRELENLVERLVVTTNTDTITVSDLPFTDKVGSSSDIPLDWGTEYFNKQKLTLQEALEDVEKRWLKRAYRQYKTTYEMASYLGISQSTVVRRLRKYNIKKGL